MDIGDIPAGVRAGRGEKESVLNMLPGLFLSLSNAHALSYHAQVL